MKTKFKLKRNRFFGLMIVVVMVISGVLNLLPAVNSSAATTYIRIKNVWQETYLYEENNQVKYGTASDEKSHWELVDAGNGMVRIKNRATGNYMNIENQRAYVESTGINNEWESAKWVVTDAGNSQKRIRNQWLSTSLHVENLIGAVQCGQIYDVWASAKWVFESPTGEVIDPTPDPVDPVDPNPVDPDPVDPVDPNPVDPDPVDPDPVDPTEPWEPTPIPDPEPGTRGATVPYTRYESEDARKGGSAVLYHADKFQVEMTAAEASNQKYVGLKNTGDYVEWTVNESASGLTIRYTMPDSSNGMGLYGKLSAYVNGVKQEFDVSSYSNWQYFSGDHPQDAPGINPRFRFDEVHFILNNPVNAGDTIRIQKDLNDGIEYGVDFIEIEAVPAPITRPANSYSVTEYGAIANDGKDDLAAFVACVAAADKANKDVYIPAGQFDLNAIWVIEASHIKITGAGMWYTNIYFMNPNRQSGGISGSDSCSNLDFGNMYINSALRSRYDQQAVYKCFMDTYGTDSVIHDFWLEHFECGFWIGDYDIPVIATDNLTIANGRIRNNLADGVNFCQGTKNSTVVNCSVRNNGDDGLAVWPDSTMGAPMGVNNTFKFNTIENNWRAAGIAIFGGSGHKAHNNYIKDTFKGSAIRLNTTFPGYHFDNNQGITFSDTTIVNSGTSNDCYGGERGAIDLEASNGSIRNITFENIEIYNSQRSAFQMGYGSGFFNIVFKNINVDGTGLDGITTSRFTQQHKGAVLMSYTQNGSVTLDNVTYRNVASENPFIVPAGFTVNVR